jgi:hypothetical protein
MSLSTQVRAILDRNKITPEQRDAEHAVWLQEPSSIIDILRQPLLGIKPSERSVDDNRTLLIQKLKDLGHVK